MGLSFLEYPVLFENDAAVSAFVGVVLLEIALWGIAWGFPLSYRA
jgi:hypothetical protein